MAGEAKRLGVTDLVVWGLNTGTHSHRYIHRAIFDCFRALGRAIDVPVHWHDDASTATPPWNSSRARPLVFSSPHYDLDNHLPTPPGAWHVAHADWPISWTSRQPIERYDRAREEGRAVMWQVFRGAPPPTKSPIEISKRELTYHVPAERRIVAPWATDLLPYEVESTLRWLPRAYRRGKLFPRPNVLFVGNVWQRNEEAIRQLEKACAGRGLRVEIQRIDSTRDVARATRASFMAPAVQGEGQMKTADQYYVPCRILKNISYGAVGVTNNRGVADLFGNTIVHAPNIEDMVDSYCDFVSGFGIDELAVMQQHVLTVRDHHTYVTRLTRCLELLGHN